MPRKKPSETYAKLQEIIKSAHTQEITLAELVDSDDIKPAMIDFIIFSRVQQLLVRYTIEPDDIVTLEKRIKVLHKENKKILIQLLQNFPSITAKHWQADAIARTVNPLLQDLKLSQQKNDEWALQYLAQFFSTRTRNQLFFYANPFVNLKTKEIPSQRLVLSQEVELNKINSIQFSNRGNIYILFYSGLTMFNRLLLPEFSENRTIALLIHVAIVMIQTHLAVSKLFMPIVKYSPFIWHAADSGFLAGLKNVIELEHEKMTISFLIFFMLSLLSFKALESFALHTDDPIVDYVINKLAPVCASSIITSQLFYPFIQRSPFAYTAASAAMQINLMQYINHKIYPVIAPEIIPPQSATTAKKPVCIVQDNPTEYFSKTIADENKNFEPQKIPKLKKQSQSSTVQFLRSLQSAPQLVKVSWQDPTVEPLYGVIVKTKKNIPKIDLIPTPGKSVAWSTNSSIDTCCNHDVLSQSETYTTTMDPIDSKFSSIISYAQVVPPVNHTGLVLVQKNDPDFPEEKYKYKVKGFHKNATDVWRVGIFRATSSSIIECVDDPKKKLPDGLKDTVFHLYKPGERKRTH